jgi:hypothetical protein
MLIVKFHQGGQCLDWMYPPDESSSHWWCINCLWTKFKICFSAHWMPYWCCRVYSFESLKHHHLEGCKLENPSSNPRLMAEWYRVYGTLEPQKRSGFQTPTGMQVKILPALCPWAWLGGCQRLVRSGLLLCFLEKKKNPSFKIQALKVGSRSDV